MEWTNQNARNAIFEVESLVIRINQTVKLPFASQTVNVVFIVLNYINKRPSFTVKNPHLQLVRIDHVISVYLPLTGKTVRLWTLTFVSWFNHGRVFNKFKPLNIWIKWFLLSFYSSESCHLSEYTLKLFNLAGFLAHVQQFSLLLDKFEVWVSCEAVCNIFYWFLCLIF